MPAIYARTFFRPLMIRHDITMPAPDAMRADAVVIARC